MNNKGQYYQESSNKGLVFVIVLVVVVFIIGLGIAMYKAGALKGLPLFQSIPEKINLVPPPSNVNFCLKQNVAVGNGLLDMRTQQVIGWDSISECCVRTYEGYSDCLGKNLELSICYTSEVNGLIRFARVNGFNLPNVNEYTYVIRDLHKQATGRTDICGSINYPEQVK